jgi:DNA-binding GntR family transcriptional regulator
VSSLVNLTAPSLREQAARAIRTGIITGEITPGELYSVRTLSSRLGVSATPVREAMLDLEGEGLVESVRNRGFRVKSLSTRDVDDILRLRLLLEVPSMGDVAESHRDEDIPRFRALAEQLPEHVTAGDLQGYLDADQEFHLGLLGLLGNTRLVDIVRMLRHQSRLYDVGKLVNHGELIESAHEHGQIVTAIERRDRARTQDLVTRHLERARKISDER